jgi:membrane fusion protein (multidrug efflux system)
MAEPQSSGGTPPKSNGGESASSGKDDKRSIWKRPTTIVIGTLILAAVFIWGLGLVAKGFSHESTDDAFLAANIVSIAPRISGQVKEVFVQDNQLVKKGDPLVQIDPRDFDTALAQKKAALVAADSNTNVILSTFKMLEVQVTAAEATAKQSEAQAAADQATAEKALADMKRAEDLSQRKVISPQEYDSANATARAATNTAAASLAKAASDKSKVDEAQAELEAGRAGLERAIAQANEAGVDVDLAALSLSYTRIYAPMNGRVTRKAVEVGDYLQVGQQLMAIVPDNIWVVANFKETQLTKIRTNQPVEISVDSVRGRTFAGHVQSIQAGSGAAFSLLPPENAVGNYVKVVQRVPVKITFDNPVEAGHVLGPGMSADPSVLVGAEIPQAFVVIVAIILALTVGFFWRRWADKPAA